MKTTKPEPPSKADPKSPRRPRPLTPAPWLDEVRPDEDVMAVFYGRTPAPAPAPVADPPAPAVEPASDAPVEPVSRSPEIRSPAFRSPGIWTRMSPSRRSGPQARHTGHRGAIVFVFKRGFHKHSTTF
jgi:hypothetical protein